MKAGCLRGPRVRAFKYLLRKCLAATVLLVGLASVALPPTPPPPKRIYIANDEHTDYF
jgi:hypothetical protein